LWRRGNCGLRAVQRVVTTALREEVLRLLQQCIRVLRIFLEHGIDQRVGSGGLSAQAIGTRQAQLDVSRDAAIRGQRFQTRDGVVRAPSHHIVVGEGEHRLRILAIVRDLLQVFFRVVELARAEQERRHRAIGKRVLRIGGNRRGELGLRFGESSSHPKEVRKGEMPSDALRVEFHAASEGLLGVRLTASTEFDKSQLRVRRTSRRIETHGLVDGVERLLEIPQSGKSISSQQVRGDAVRLLLEGSVGTRQRIGGAAPLQQHRAGGELEVDIIGQEVGGSHVFVERIRTITEQRVCLCETLPSFAEARVDLNRVAVLDDRLA
jgi:hypothetical protein